MALFRKRHPRIRTLAAAIVALLVSAPLIAEEAVDLAVVHRIRQEALQNSKVMDHLFYLTDVHGPRLTNSPGFFGAADWVVKQLGEWGIRRPPGKMGTVRSRLDVHALLGASGRTAARAAGRVPARV